MWLFFAIICVIAMIGIIGFISIAVATESTGCVIFTLVLGGFAIYGLYLEFQKFKSVDEWQQKEMIYHNAFQKKLDEAREILNSAINTRDYYIWIEGNQFCWFPNKESVTPWEIKNIAIDKIIFYKQFGDMYTETTGSGGNSSYSLLTGAHGKINPVEISTTVHDNRDTKLFYNNGGSDEVVLFGYDDFINLKRLLPDKDYAIVEAVRVANATKEVVTFDLDEQLEARLAKVKKLYDNGIITEEEYQKKRTDILSEL